MTLFLSVSILAFVAVVSVRSATIVETNDRGFDIVPVRSPESRPDVHGQASLLTNNNNRGFLQGRERTYHDSDRRETGNQRNRGVSELNANGDRDLRPGAILLNSELLGDRRYEIKSHSDTEQRRNDVNSFNLGFNRRENTDYNQRRPSPVLNSQRGGVQGNYEINTDKTLIDEFDTITEHYRHTTKQNYKHFGTNHRKIGNPNDGINSQNNGNIKQTTIAVFDYDNNPKPGAQNSVSSQDTRSGNNQNNSSSKIVQENNNEADTIRGSSTERPVTQIDNNENNQRKVTQDNEVTPKTSQEGRKIPSGTREKSKEIDRWIWSDGEKVTQVTTDSSSTVAVDDRGSFTIDKCPTGKVRFGNACVDIV